MLTMRKALLFVLFITFIILSGCQSPIINEENAAKYSNHILAKADNDFAYSTEDFYKRLVSSSLLAKGGFVEMDVLKNILDSLVLDTLTGFEADEIDLSNYYYDNWTYRLRYYDYLTQVFLFEKVYSQVTADSQEVMDFYELRPDLFGAEEQMELSHIFLSKIGLIKGKDSLYYKSLSDEELDKALEEYTDKIYKMVVYGESFASVANDYSHDELSRRAAGYVGWTTRGIYIEPFDSVAFSLEPGAYSAPYKDKDGWHIVYMHDYIPTGLMPMERDGVFDGVRESLMTYKSNKLGVAIMDSLYKEINVVVNEEILDTDVYKVDDSVWAGIVNGIDTIDVKEMKNIEHVYRKKYSINNSNPEMKKQMLQDISRRYIIIQAAREAGYDTLSRVVQERERLRHLTSKSVVEKSIVDISWSPTEEQVRQYYDENINDYVVKKPNHVQYLAVGDSLFAEFLRDQALTGLSFEELLKADFTRQSDIKVKLTDLGYIGDDYQDSVFYRQVATAPLLGISGPYRKDEGYILIKILDRKQSLNYNQARGQIITQLTQDYRKNKRLDFKNKLFAKYHVTFPQALQKISLKPYQYRAQQ